MKCKTKTPTVSVHQIINKKGRPMLQGNCCKKSGRFLITMPMLAAAAAATASLAGGATAIA